VPFVFSLGAENRGHRLLAISVPACGASFPRSGADDFRVGLPLPAVAISVLMLKILRDE